MAAQFATDLQLAPAPAGQTPRLIGLVGGSLPCENDAVHHGNAQTAVIRRWLGEQVKSTLCGP